MIICPKCSTGNSNTAFRCKDCDYYLKGIAPTPDRDYVGEVMAKMQADRRPLSDPLNIVLIFLAVPILILSIIGAFNVPVMSGYTIMIAFLFPYTAYYCICYPNKIFELRHRFYNTKRRIDPEITPSFALKCVIWGWVLIVLTYVYMLIMVLHK